MQVSYIDYKSMPLDRKFKKASQYQDVINEVEYFITQQTQKNLETGQPVTTQFRYKKGADMRFATPDAVIIMSSGGGAKSTKSTASKSPSIKLLGDFDRESQSEALQKLFGERFRAPQVDGLSKHNIPTDLTKWRYTVKTDGKHCYVAVGVAADTVVDCEFFNDKYYVFDILRLGGKDDVQRQTFQQRFDQLEVLGPTLPSDFVIKTFTEIVSKDLDGGDVAFLKKLLAEHSTIEGIDGVIFTPIDQTYQNTISMKLKPKRFLTNDYKLRLAPSAPKAGVGSVAASTGFAGVTYDLYTAGSIGDYNCTNAIDFVKMTGEWSKKSLFKFSIPYVVGGNFSDQMRLQRTDINYLRTTFEDYDPVLFKLAMTSQLDGKIVECTYDDNMKCYPLRLRDDKENPNSFNTCVTNFENRLTCFENAADLSYFNIKKEDVDPRYDTWRDFGNDGRRRVLVDAIDELKRPGSVGTDTLLDFGAGRGVSLDIVVKAGFRHILAFEPDIDAQVTFYQRLRNIQEQTHSKLPETFLYSWDSSALFADRKVSLFVSNYSFHYNHKDREMFDGALRYVSQVQKGGLAYLIYYGGKQIYDLLASCPKGIYHTDMFHIERLYDPDEEFADLGQTIKILLPTISSELTTEWLINTKFLADELHSFGFDMQHDTSFGDIVTIKPAADQAEYFGLIRTVQFKRASVASAPTVPQPATIAEVPKEPKAKTK